jgi:hypothetical protein
MHNDGTLSILAGKTECFVGNGVLFPWRNECGCEVLRGLAGGNIIDPLRDTGSDAC